MNAINFLIKEHEKVRITLADISSQCHRYITKRKLFHDVSKNIIRHEEMEHQIWYPYFKKHKKLSGDVMHFIIEENSAKRFIGQLDNIMDEEEWLNSFLKFKNAVENHAADEEENLFPKVRKFLSESALLKIGKEMLNFKKQYKSN